MTIPFYTGNIHQPLQQLLSDADNNGDFQPVLDYCEPLIETTEEDGVILCYSFALMEQAMAIHVDDVEKTANQCLELLKRLKHTYGGTDHFKRMIRREIRKAKDLKKQENDLLKISYENLTLSEKTTLAYNLQNKGGVENNKRAAEIHKELILLKEQNADSYYHSGQYIISLYNSNQLDEANKAFEIFSTKMKGTPQHGYAFLVKVCYQEKILQYLNDKVMLEQIWNEATTHPAIGISIDFPLTDVAQEKVLIAAHELGLQSIVKYLSDLIVAERKPRMIPEAIKKIIS
jgi:hypothetical protein